MNRRRCLAVTLAGAAVTFGGCSAPAPTSPSVNPLPSASAAGTPAPEAARAPDGRPFVVTERATFTEPWAMAFLPGTPYAAVTERTGALHLVEPATGSSRPVAGVPAVEVAGQGGLGDVVPGPTFTDDGTLYLSWVEQGDGGTGAVIGRGRLLTDGEPRLEGVEVIWRQEPKLDGNGHFSHRLAFSPDGRFLFVSSGDRQKFTPAQDTSNNLGSILRLTPDGAPAPENPLAGRGGHPEIWSYGHRNPLGLAFAPDGQLWSSEMGPQGGDELNRIIPGANYGWPEASNGSHYGGGEIPDHRAGDGFEAPLVGWTPSISPGSLMIYSGEAFGPWQGDAFLGALSGRALVRVDLQGETAVEADRWDMGQRIREVEQGPDGSIWLLEVDPGGRLLQLTPP